VSSAPREEAFVRDRTTYVAYAVLGAFGYAIYALGPLMAHLREEEHLSHTVTSLHGTLFFLGMLFGGLAIPRLVVAYGLSRSRWASIALTAVCTIALALAHQAVVSIGLAFLLGIVVAPLPVWVAAVLHDRHGRHVHIALTEANVAASVAACLVPATLGLLALGGVSWRLALLLPLVVYAACAILRPTAVGIHSEVASTAPPERPRGGFGLWLAVLAAGSVCEGGVVFWGASLLDDRAGVSLDAATTLLIVFFAGELLSRIAVGRALRTVAPPVVLTTLFALSGLGLVVLWLTASAPLAVVALALAGLGIGGIFPLAYSVAMTAAFTSPSSAAARITNTSSAVSICVPLVFGVIGDAVGLRTAFLAGPVAAVVGLLVLAWVRRLPPVIGHPPRRGGGVVFDLDGTLVDSFEPHFRALTEVLARRGVTIDRDWALERAGLSLDRQLVALADESGVELDVGEIALEREQLFLERLHELVLREDVVGVARRLHGVVPIAVASAGDGAVVRATLAATGIAHLFPVVVTRDDVAQTKPAPDAYLVAARLLGVDPARSVAYEDSDEGRRSARSAGMAVVAV
jgi:beta-phosphoglucomutase-like phosphatase (HAD superfamily)/fucose permease